MQLTPHFSLDELTHSQTAARMGLDNDPAPDVILNLKRLALVLEEVRSLLDNKPILISSGYRSPAVNEAVGGVPSSAHVKGLACDFTCPGYGKPKIICRLLEYSMITLNIDQLIHEFGSWVHLGLSDGQARCMTLTIDGRGTRQGFA